MELPINCYGMLHSSNKLFMEFFIHRFRNLNLLKLVKKLCFTRLRVLARYLVDGSTLKSENTRRAILTRAWSLGSCVKQQYVV